MSSVGPPMSPEEAAAKMKAAMAALHAFNVEAFTLLGIGTAITALRSYARLSQVGFKGLWADDYLVVAGLCFYAVETALAYMVGNKAHGLANNSMTEEQRFQLSPDSLEYQTRVLGSKIQLCGWTSYSLLLWCLKGAMCTFFFRLTKDLDGYRTRIYIGFGFLVTSWLVVMLNLLLSCQPFHHMWQIYPNPGIYCQPAISPALIWTYLSFNVATDIYLIAIPMPMLFKAAMPMMQRLWLMILFSLGLFVTGAAILRVVLLVSDPINGAQLAGSWAVRETFVAVITTNLPMLFPHLKRWSSPLISRISTQLSTKRSAQTDSAYPTTIDSWRSKGRNRGSFPLSGNPPQDKHHNASEEHMVALEEMQAYGMKEDSGSTSSAHDPGVRRQVELSVLAENEDENMFPPRDYKSY